MRVPDYLDETAKSYWRRHAPALTAAGILTERDVEAFALLCLTWSLIRCTDPTLDSKMAIRFIAASKQYQQLARQFSLLPVFRRKDNLDTTAVETDEFGL